MAWENHSRYHWSSAMNDDRPLPPPVGGVNLGDLRRLTPISRSFGFDRGQPIDRYYIERFLGRQAADIRGRVMEMGDRQYTTRFGGDRVVQSDVLDLPREDAIHATIIADLTACDHVASDQFDCIIFTQTLQFIYDAAAAVASLHRLLKPGGVLLATFPALSQICRFDMDRWGDYWRFTTASITRLLSDAFSREQVHVEAYGNVLTSIAFLTGLSAHELEPAELDFYDPDYQLLIAARAVK